MYALEFETLLKSLAVTYYHAGNYSACIETIGKLKTEGDQLLINVLNDAKNKLAAKQWAKKTKETIALAIISPVCFRHGMLCF